MVLPFDADAQRKGLRPQMPKDNIPTAVRTGEGGGTQSLVGNNGRLENKHGIPLPQSALEQLTLFQTGDSRGTVHLLWSLRLPLPHSQLGAEQRCWKDIKTLLKIEGISST